MLYIHNFLSEVRYDIKHPILKDLHHPAIGLNFFPSLSGAFSTLPVPFTLCASEPLSVSPNIFRYMEPSHRTEDSITH